MGIVTVRRRTLDAGSDRDSFMGKADPALLRNWGDANGALWALFLLCNYSPTLAQEKKIPPPRCEEQPSLRSTAAAPTITRVSSAAPHSFQKTRSFDAITGLEAKSRGTQQFYAIEGPFYCIILLLNRLSFSNPNKNLCKCGTTEYHLLAHFGLIRPSLKQAIVVWVPIFVYFWPFCAGIWQFYALFIRCQ